MSVSLQGQLFLEAPRNSSPGEEEEAGLPGRWLLHPGLPLGLWMSSGSQFLHSDMELIVLLHRIEVLIEPKMDNTAHEPGPTSSFFCKEGN